MQIWLGSSPPDELRRRHRGYAFSVADIVAAIRALMAAGNVSLDRAALEVGLLQLETGGTSLMPSSPTRGSGWVATRSCRLIARPRPIDQRLPGANADGAAIGDRHGGEQSLSQQGRRAALRCHGPFPAPIERVTSLGVR